MIYVFKPLRVLQRVLSFACIFGSVQTQAQRVTTVPNAFLKACRLGTRTVTGIPGSKYWENDAHYDISLEIRPPDRRISGHERISYYNESPDSLKELHLRLIQNVHIPRARRDQDVDSGYFSTGMHISSLRIGAGIRDPAELAIAPGHNGTWKILKLSQVLAPLDSLLLTLDWTYDLSDSRSTQPRDGVVDSTTFFIAYFYPRLDVYDDVDGWNLQDFTELQEFYNDFCSYRVTVDLPARFQVWATGKLSLTDEGPGPRISQKLQSLSREPGIINIHTPVPSEIRSAKQGIRSWIFTADSVTDFALGLSDHYTWDAVRIRMPGGLQREMVLQTAYPVTSRHFSKVAAVSRTAISFLSSQLPGLPFPYPGLTVFNGLSAMEYPMMVNDYDDADTADMEALTDHEISHTYFPFYMGTNESRYAFMDEGWAAFFELMITRLQLGQQRADSQFRAFYLNAYPEKSPEWHHPIMSPSGTLRGISYEVNSYGKPALAYLALQDLLGDSVFKACLLGYMAEWHGKHPGPWDFFHCFNHLSGQNLNWFWDNWFFSHKGLGVSIRSIKYRHGMSVIVLKNTGGFAVPVDLCFSFKGAADLLVHESPVIWKDHHKQKIFQLCACQPDSIRISSGLFH
jgi:hypothetical protein